MKTMNKKITGIAAAVSLLTMMAGAVYAADVCCDLGTVVEAGSQFRNFTTGFTVATSHGVTLTCDTDIGFGTTAGNGKRTFELPGATKDAMLATALTALADDKKVKYCLFNATEPSAGTNKNGHVRTIYVTTTPVP